MKAIVKTAAVIAFMFTTVVSMAKETKSYLVKTTNAKSLVFKLDNLKEEKTTVKLLDANLNIIFSENLSGKTDDYVKNFDFKNLESGVYFLKAESDLKTTKYIIHVRIKDVVVVDKKEINKPLFSIKGDKLYVTLINEDLKNIDFLVYNGANELVFEETLKDFNIQKVFDFENAYVAGDYTVIVKDAEGKYNKFIIEN